MLNSRAVFASGVKVAGDEHLDMLGGPEWGQREASPPRDPLPSFGFTQEQVACVCEVSDPIYDFFLISGVFILIIVEVEHKMVQISGPLCYVCVCVCLLVTPYCRN